MNRAHSLLCALAVVLGFSASDAEEPTADKYREAASRKEGNPDRGRSLFEDKRSMCSQCHTVDGSGSSVGPDLYSAGDKFSRADLIKSVLEPSASIMTGYATTIIETKKNETFSGILKSISDRELVLANLGNIKTTILKSNILKQSTSPASLMPAGLHAALKLEEFTDLIAYLESLKQPNSKAANKHGTPIQIPRLKKPIKLIPVFGKTIELEKPVWFGQHPTIDSVFTIVEKSHASVSLLERTGDGKELKTQFVEILDEVYVTNDEGLLGFAFHPKFATNRKYYFMHEVKDGTRRGMVIGEREAREDLRADSGRPTRIVLEFEVATQFHHGGGIKFGPDGFLYIGMGDGGPQEDPQGHAQDLTSFSGKLLRIDVNRNEGEMAYAIPKNNPFINHPDPNVRREIFAYGLRQPWRFSFDPANGDLWVGDVGQNRFEEVSIVRSGENHGWNVFEGFELFSTHNRKESVKLVPPVVSFRRTHGVSVTGGYVIRSKASPKTSFEGVYVCADYQSKRLWGITQHNRKLEKIREIGQCSDRVVAFGTDRKGSLYAIGYDEGIIYKLEFQGSVFE